MPGLRIETRYFINTQQRPEAKAMIRSLFLSMQELSKGANRPAGHPKTSSTRSPSSGPA